MSSIISPALRGLFKLRQSAITNFAQNPIETQQQVFNALISSAQYTEFGKKFHFEKLNTIEDFKKNVTNPFTKMMKKSESIEKKVIDIIITTPTLFASWNVNGTFVKKLDSIKVLFLKYVCLVSCY